MDMSMSMYATDIKPNRLTQAKYKARDLLKQWSEGSTGLIVYAGDAYTVSPMTSDTHTILNLIPNLSPDLMPFQGANAAIAVEQAISMMKNTGLSQGDIVLFTDDIDDQEADNIETLLKGTKWRLTILGVGSQAGAPIQLSDGTLLKSESGHTVVAKSNFANMAKLARTSKSLFTPIQLNNSDIEAISRLTNEVEATSTRNQAKCHGPSKQRHLVSTIILYCSHVFRRGVVFALLVVICLP